MFMNERKSCALLYAQCIILFSAIISPNFTSLFQNHIVDKHMKFSALLQVGLALFWLIHLHGVNLLDLSPICHKHPTTLCLCHFNKQTLNLTEARKKIKLQCGLLAHAQKYFFCNNNQPNRWNFEELCCLPPFVSKSDDTHVYQV
jgi:hypothetical protein